MEVVMEDMEAAGVTGEDGGNERERSGCGNPLREQPKEEEQQICLCCQTQKKWDNLS